jgi:hypothetical protein
MAPIPNVKNNLDLARPCAGFALVGLLRALLVGIKKIEEGIWLVSFMNYVDLEEKLYSLSKTLFGPKVLPM